MWRSGWLILTLSTQSHIDTNDNQDYDHDHDRRHPRRHFPPHFSHPLQVSWESLAILGYGITRISALAGRPRWFALSTATNIPWVVSHPFPNGVNRVFRQLPLHMTVKVTIVAAAEVRR
jgi:thiamine monophosphate kinase